MKTTLRRLLPLLLLGATLRAGEFASPADWPFKTVFPAAPKLEKREPEGVRAAYLASCEYNGEQFRLLRVVPLRAVGPADAEKTYDQARKKYFSGKEKVLIDELNTTVRGLPARRYVFASHKGKRVTDLTVILCGGEIFELSHEAALEAKVTAEVTRFEGQ
jgi:hypothetical protein